MNIQDEKLIKDFLYKTENQSETNLELFWIIPPILFSRQFLRKKIDIIKFTTEVLSMEFSDYVYKSRSILVGRIMKKIKAMDITDSVPLRNNLVDFLNENLNKMLENEKKDSKNGKETKNGEDFFGDWSNFLKKN